MMKPLKPSKRCACTKGHPGAGILPRPGPCVENDARNPDKEQLLVVNLSGRGDKDISPFTIF